MIILHRISRGARGTLYRIQDYDGSETVILASEERYVTAE